MTVFDKNIAATGAFIIAITIVIGAFGAHGLKEVLETEALNSFEVGVRYQMYHALGILILGIYPSLSQKIKKKVFWFFLLGIFFFSGSIYLLSMNSMLPFSVKPIGFITPIGGLLFIIGWIILAYEMLTLKKR